MSALHFLRPEWLWLLLALLPLAWWLRRRASHASPWRGEVDPHLLARLLDPAGGGRGNLSGLLALPALALAIVALAGPSWARAEQPLWQSRAPLVVALDLSGAMAATDVPPSRLARARAKLDALLQQRRGGEVGLLAFDQDAYVVAPLTDDAANVALFVDALSPGIMPLAHEPGGPSRAAPAIERAVELLRQAGFGHGDILVMSDHAAAGAREAAGHAAAAGYRVSALGLGTAQGAAWRDALGSIRQARLDEASLRALARAGGGGYAVLAADASDLSGLGLLDPRDTAAAAGGDRRARAWQDQGYWLLLPLLLLVPFAFRRGSALAMLLLCVLLPLRPAQATGIDWWQRDDQQAYAAMERGRVAYRAGDFDAAAKAWQGLPGADAAYNRGNALAKQGRYQDAIDAYDQALRRQPGMEDAISNRKAVLAAMKRQPPAGGKQPGDRQGDGDQGQGQAGDQGSSGERQQQPGEGTGQDEARGNDAKGDAAKAPEPGDGTAQQAADAAQRERMEQALKQAQSAAKSSNAETVAGETTAEREQRLANEAWLRRVPDDPGGLLRERFRLEQLRRERERR